MADAYSTGLARPSFGIIPIPTQVASAATAYDALAPIGDALDRLARLAGAKVQHG